MRKFIVLMIFLTSCSTSTVSENSNSVALPNPVVAQTNDNSDSTRKLNDSISKTWNMRISNSKVRTAVVMTNGKTPDGEAQTILWLQCPTDPNYGVAIDYIIRDSSKITGFNFNDFEGPDAPAQGKLMEIRAVSPTGNLSFRDSVGGVYGGAGESDAFIFETGSIKKDKTMRLTRLAQMIAKGSTEVTFIVHDSRDYRKTIETTFPAIDPSSDVAKILKGCRK